MPEPEFPQLEQRPPESYRSASLQLIHPFARATEERASPSSTTEPPATEADQALAVMWAQVSKMWDTSLEQVHHLEQALERLGSTV